MSKKSSVDSNNYYLYPEWFEGGNQSQPSTSSYSYPTLEYIGSNAVRLTRTVHSNLQDEIEYLEKNISGGGGSCNCSELQYGIDKNSTKIYYNSVNITSNANKIANLSDIKLSRDGSQPMTGLLTCQSGLKTNSISTVSGNIIECNNYLKVNKRLWGNEYLYIGCGTESALEYAQIKFDYQDFLLLTPGSSGSLLERIYIYGGSDHGLIVIKNADVYPGSDNSWNLGSSSFRWANIHALKGNFSGTIVPDAILTNSANITSNTSSISNLSTIKLSRDGSQPMTGVLTCQGGLKTNTIDTISGNILECKEDLIVSSHIWGNTTLTIGGGGGFTEGYPHIKFMDNDLILLTPGESGPLERIYIYGGWDDSEIMIKNADLAPFTDNRWDLGFPGYTWRCVYAAKGNFSGIIIPDAILTNSANISDLDARVDYLEENLSACNCSALQFGIDSNTTEIANLSTIKLSRDGSQTMTGLLQCESGLKTDTIDSYSGDTVECSDDLKINGDLLGDSTDGLNLKAEDNDNVAMIELSPGSTGRILMSTPTSQGVVLPRIEIPDGIGNVDVTFSNAHVIPSIDDWQDLGNPNRRWKNVYAEFVYSSNISSLEARVEYLESIIGEMGGRGGYSAIVYKDNGVIYAKNPNGDTIAQGAAGTDDASIIQTAIDQAGFIFIARGEYTIKETLTIKGGASHTKIYGELGKTVLIADTSDNLIELGEVGKYSNFIEIGYMSLHGEYTSPVAIKMFRQLSPTLTHLGIVHFTDAGIRIGGYTCHAAIISCNIASNGNYGIDARYGYYESGGLQPLSIRDSVIHYNDINIYLHNTMAEVASVAFGSGSIGIRLLNVKDVVLNNCYWEAETYGIKIKEDGGACKLCVIMPYFGSDVDTKLEREGSPDIDWIGGWNQISRSGTATFSGDGSTEQFTIAHGLIATPANVQVTPCSEDAAHDFYTTVDDTNIYVNYLSPPPSGSNNIKLDWQAKI